MSDYKLSHLQELEAESIHIIREVAAEFENPVMLYSIGKDSSVMVRLAEKAFAPGKVPFPLMHIDSKWKFKEMIEFRDSYAKKFGWNLIVESNMEAFHAGVGPFTHGSKVHTDLMKTQALLHALDKYKFDAAFGGARRDEEKSRAKERIFSFRDKFHQWDPKNQRPELWDIYNARVHKGEITFYNLDGEEIEKELKVVDWDAEAAEKAGFEHFMMKEIHEQPKAVQDTLNSVIKDGVIDLSAVEITEEEIQKFEQIYIVACGSAWHVGMAAQYVLEELADIPVEVDLASEFRYRNPKLVKNSLVVIVSQSGETADSLAALRLAKERKIPVLGIVNVVGSSIARESDYILYTYAGPEISVATTKAYSTQLIAMYLLAIQAAKVKDVIAEERYAALIEELGTLPEKIQKTLDDKERIQWFASKYANAKDVFFIGRGIDYAISMEGSLKMKEISYIHSEAYAAGELKHGTISLIEDGILVVGVATQAALFEKTISNMVEVKSRGAYLMGLTTYGNYNIEDTADFAVYVPQTESFFATSLAIVPLQLMGYYVSVAKGLDVDKPRNLAKSVTVE